MVWPNSQLKCSSIRPSCTLPSSAQASMSNVDEAGAAATPSAEEPASPRASDGSDSGGEPTATETLAPAGGQAPSGAEAPPLADVGGRPGSSGDGGPALGAMAGAQGKNILAEIQALKAEQKLAREAKLKITKELRNAEKRRQRLKKRAKQLSDSDLLAVITLRSAEQGVRKKEGGEPTAAAASAEQSDTGTATPTSSTAATTPQKSPRQATSKQRIS